MKNILEPGIEALVIDSSSAPTILKRKMWLDFPTIPVENYKPSWMVNFLQGLEALRSQTTSYI